MRRVNFFSSLVTLPVHVYSLLATHVKSVYGLAAASEEMNLFFYESLPLLFRPCSASVMGIAGRCEQNASGRPPTT
jgi:hypothetical protein